MPLVGASSSGGYTDPRTEQHIREVLAKLKQVDSANASTSTTLAADVAVLEAVIGLEEAIFDSTTVIGQPLYISGSDNVELADASALSTSDVVGICHTAATAGNAGKYITNGIITQTVWTTVMGSIKLTAGAIYYLSTTTGELTATSPTAAGEVSIRIGHAIDDETLSVNIQKRIRL